MRTRHVAPVVLAAALLWATGCGKSQPKDEHQSSESATPQTHEHAPPPAAQEPGHGGEHEAVTPQGSAAEVWGQISNEQAKIEEVIRTGRLAEVHHLAFAIRDLSVAAVGKAPSSADATRLQETLSHIKESAATLDEYGDAGNLGGVKQEYARFQRELATLKSLAGGL